MRSSHPPVSKSRYNASVLMENHDVFQATLIAMSGSSLWLQIVLHHRSPLAFLCLPISGSARSRNDFFVASQMYRTVHAYKHRRDLASTDTGRGADAWLQ